MTSGSSPSAGGGPSSSPGVAGKKGRRRWLAAVVLASLMVLAVGLAGLVLQRLQPTEPQPRPTAASPELAPRDDGVAPEPGTSQQPVTSQQPGISSLPDPAWVQRVSAATGIPARVLGANAGADLYVREHRDCAVGWNTLAGIGWVESHHGTIAGSSIDDDGVARPPIIGIALDGTRTAEIPDTDGGELDGDTEWDRAVGPMQFIPQTWFTWGTDGNGDEVADPHQIDDAALSAARYLCHARGTLGDDESWIAAIRSYNNSVEYQQQVASAAKRYAERAASSAG